MKIKTILLALALLINPLLASGEAEDDETVVAAAPKKKGRHAVELVKNEHVTVMDLSNEKELRNIEFLRHFPCLTDLNLSECFLLGDNYCFVSALTNLRKLNLFDNVRSTTLVPLKSLTNLTDLNLGQNHYLTSVKDICSLPQLICLNLSGNHLMADLEEVGKLTTLTSLDLSLVFNRDEVPYPKTLDFLSSLVFLKKLNINCNDGIFSIKSLRNLPRLKILSVGYCPNITDWEFLAPFPALKKLKFEFVNIYFDISFLSTLTSLEDLYVYHRTKLPPLSNHIRIHLTEG